MVTTAEPTSPCTPVASRFPSGEKATHWTPDVVSWADRVDMR